MYYGDINSKNVMVHDGIFSGLVDLDGLTQGDPLEAVGRMKKLFIPISLMLLAACGQRSLDKPVSPESQHVANKKASDVELLRSYSQWGGEAERLSTNPAQIVERLRTESILRRFTPKPPAVVYDIGGGAGVYAFQLTQKGYDVHLIDIVPLHIEQATTRMQQTGVKLAECAVGDARNIQAKDAVADIVLLFGPLYHLQEKQDRLKALREAYRILKPGGLLFAAAITRIGVIFHMGNKNKLKDPYFAAVAEKCLKTGVYSEPKSKAFTTGYFHNVDEFENEVQSIGFKNIQLVSVEGPVSLFSSLNETVKDQHSLDKLLYFLELIEKDRSSMGAGGHIMAIGKK